MICPYFTTAAPRAMAARAILCPAGATPRAVRIATVSAGFRTSRSATGGDPSAVTDQPGQRIGQIGPEPRIVAQRGREHL